MQLVSSRRRGLWVLKLLLVLLLAAPTWVRSEVVLAPRPGSREAANRPSGLVFRSANVNGAFVRSPSGLLVPDRRITTYTQQGLQDEGRWLGIRRAVVRYLGHTGARLSPAPYQDLVSKIQNRANSVLARDGKNLSGWKAMVVEGGMADQVNAAAWTGGVITIFRPLVDLCYQIANVTVNASAADMGTELWKLSRWRSDKRNNTMPGSLKLAPSDRKMRDIVAESILSRVVLHEMGHGASGHVELRKPELYLPGKHKAFDAAASRAKEREADLFATVLGVKGAVRFPGVMPLFTYYNFISRPNFDERGKNMVADWRSHPLDAERYNNQVTVLTAAKRNLKGLPEALAPRIILPNGDFASPLPAAKPDIQPAVMAPPMRKAALR